MGLRRGVGIGAITNKSNIESMSKKMSEQRLDDISKSVQMLEEGIRKFIEANKEEIRNNEFLRDKIKALAASCNVDLAAATSASGRLKPGLLTSLLGDALLGGSENSNAMKKFYDFLSSRLVTVCMRERVLRGPVIPMSVVLNELRKRYPLEEITLHDLVQSIEHLKPLNPNMFILEQEIAEGNNKEGKQKEFVAGGDPSNFFIAFQPLSSSTIGSSLSSSSKNSKKKDLLLDSAASSGTDAIRIVVLANELAKTRRKELSEILKRKSADQQSGSPGINTNHASFALTSRTSPATRFMSTSSTSNNAGVSFTNSNTMLPVSIQSLELQQKLGLVEGDQPGSLYVRLTCEDVVSKLSSRSFATTKEDASKKMNAKSNNNNHNNKNSSRATSNNVWSESRAKMSLRAARELCEGWWDRVDKSTWLLVVVA